MSAGDALRQAGILAAGVAVGLVVGRWVTTGATTADAVTRADLDALRQDLAAAPSTESERAELLAELRSIRDAGAATSTRAEPMASAPPTPAPPETLAPVTPEEGDAIALHQAEQQVAHLEAALARQSTDTPTESLINETLRSYRASHPGAPAAPAVRCSRQLCQIVLQSDARGAGQQMLQDLMAEPGFRGASLFVRHPTATGFETTVFISQTDARLEALE